MIYFINLLFGKVFFASKICILAESFLTFDRFSWISKEFKFLVYGNIKFTVYSFNLNVLMVRETQTSNRSLVNITWESIDWIEIKKLASK